VTVPAETPVTEPVEPVASPVATDGLPLVHVPPDVALLNVIVDPVQTVVGPVMAGNEHSVVVTCAHHVSHLLTVACDASCKVQKSLGLDGSIIVAE
jgi:hypothetical protein